VILGGLGVTDLHLYGRDAFLSFVLLLRPDAVIANCVEHEALGLATDSPIPGATVTVVTNGEDPRLVTNDRGLCQLVPVRVVDSIRDRTGVGDGYVAGYLEARRAGADAVAAAGSGHRVAALVLRSLGPTTRG